MCLGLANGYIEPKKKSGSASLVDGHIDPIESELEKALEGKAHNCCKKFEDYLITIGIQKGNTGYRVAYEFLWDDGHCYGDYLDIGESINANKVADAVRLLYNQAEMLLEALKERKIEK